MFNSIKNINKFWYNAFKKVKRLTLEQQGQTGEKPCFVVFYHLTSVTQRLYYP